MNIQFMPKSHTYNLIVVGALISCFKVAVLTLPSIRRRISARVTYKSIFRGFEGVISLFSSKLDFLQIGKYFAWF